MSQPLQYEMHLDADQLNAFAEGALPAHEREETLAHLAVCAGCREVLSLSLPPMEDVAQPEPVPARRPWFSGWNLAWPVAVLAGLLVVALYLRTRTVSERKAVEVQQADVIAPQMLPVPPPKKPGIEGRAAEDKAAPPKRPRIATVLEGRTDAADARFPAMPRKNMKKLPLQGREVIASSNSSYDPAQVNFGGAAGSYSMSGSPINGAAGSAVAKAAPASGYVAGSGTIVRLGSSQGMAGGAAGGATVTDAAVPQAAYLAQENERAAQLAPAPKATNQSVTVEVQAQGAEIATSDAAVAGMIQPEYVPTLQPLPSGLPAIAVASGKRQMVAIDLHNNVFFSKNGGKHWKAVATQWQGRAVKVEFTPADAEFAMTTDHDGVWLSADGRSWQRN